jgi:RNA polymerase sigma-70 factor, ECF subfamily
MRAEVAQSKAVLEAGFVSADERRLVAGLQSGEEWAYAELVDRYGASFLRVAQVYVSSRAVAEEVVQDALIGVLSGIRRFEGRSSLKTWLFRVLTNHAKTRAVREGRSIPFSALEDPSEPSVEPSRFLEPGHRFAGHWASYPERWEAVPEDRLLAGEARGVVEACIAGLPPSQRAVITMRDVEGWDSADVCAALGLTEANQRVLLHRARSKVRAAVESYLSAT